MNGLSEKEERDQHNDEAYRRARSMWHRKATRSKVGKAAKAAHDWCVECRKAGRMPLDAALLGEPVRPSFLTGEEDLVFKAVVEALMRGYENRAADKRVTMRAHAVKRALGHA